MCHPVLDARELTLLGEQLGDPKAAYRFVARYVALLDDRVERLQRALDADDAEAWEDAALSLKSSSAMAGATALSLMADSARTWLKDRPSACGMPALRNLARETDRELQGFLNGIWGLLY